MACRLRGARIDAIAPAKRGRERLVALARLVIEHIDPDTAVALPWSQMPIILCTRETEVPGARLNGIFSGLKLAGWIDADAAADGAYRRRPDLRPSPR